MGDAHHWDAIGMIANEEAPHPEENFFASAPAENFSTQGYHEDYEHFDHQYGGEAFFADGWNDYTGGEYFSAQQYYEPNSGGGWY